MSSKFAKRPVALVLGLALSFAAVGGVAMAAVDASKVITSRIDSYKKIGKAFKDINDGLKADAPDAKAIAAQAKTMKDLSGHIPSWFPKGTGPETGLKTRAKADIWAEPAKFAEATKAFQVESQKLRVAAGKGDIEAIKLQVKATGGSCGGYHKPFRAEEK